MLSAATVGYVNVTLTSNVSSLTSEKRYPVSTTIRELKGKLELITGADSNTMKLQLLDSQNKPICSLDDDMATLESCQIQNGMIIHVTGSEPKDQFDDLSKVKKYEMSDEDYMKRGESVRAFKEKMKLGQFAEKGKEDLERKQKEEEEEIKNITVGSRCEVMAPKAPPKRGVVMFVGNTHFKEGYWIGIKCDEPLGKNDGSVDGKRYFDCPMNYGVFVRPSSVKVGDFPEETFSDDDEM